MFNRLLGFDRALVSSVPGTTRDLIDSEMFYNSVNLELVDSAGVRETDDFIEAQGIALSNSELKATDVVLIVLDEATSILRQSFWSPWVRKNTCWCLIRLINRRL